MLGSDLKLRGGVSIKNSVIGCHCSIGDKSSITNCVIMNNVTIGNKYVTFQIQNKLVVDFLKTSFNFVISVTLSGCILSENASISSDTEMKGCLVSKAQNVTSGDFCYNSDNKCFY